MSTVTYARPTYIQIIQSVREQMNEKEKLTPLALETQMMWVLEACQQITKKVLVEESRTIRLIQGVQDVYFQDTTGVINGTGTINVTGVAIAGVTSAGTGTVTSNNTTTLTGSGTTFRSQSKVGQLITVGTESHEIMQIQSDTVLITDVAFTTVFSGQSFIFSTTRFTRELVGSTLTVGSTITIGANSVTVASVTDAGNAIANSPFPTDQVGATFTIDTNVLEIPTRLRDGIQKIDRVESGIHRIVVIKPIGYVLQVEKEDMYTVFTNYNIPLMGGVTRDSQQRYYIHFYPVPEVTKEVTVYGYIKITPRLYILTDKLTSNIPLDESYEPCIRLYVEGMSQSWIKNYDQGNARMAQFYAMVQTLKGENRNPVQMETSYT
jgi:hypothetical protein